MVETAWGGARDADLVVLMVDASRGLVSEVTDLLKRLAERSAIRRSWSSTRSIWSSARCCWRSPHEANGMVTFTDTFMVSATTGDGLDAFLAHLAAAVPAGPWLYPEDEVTDVPLRQLAAEITREKLFERIHQELPYQATVETEQWTDQKDGSARVEQTIYVTRDSHKKIVIGKGGAAIKSISMAARKEISEIAERPIHLFLFVKVREKWGDDPERYRAMGIEFPKD